MGDLCTYLVWAAAFVVRRRKWKTTRKMLFLTFEEQQQQEKMQSLLLPTIVTLLSGPGRHRSSHLHGYNYVGNCVLLGLVSTTTISIIGIIIIPAMCCQQRCLSLALSLHLPGPSIWSCRRRRRQLEWGVEVAGWSL